MPAKKRSMTKRAQEASSYAGIGAIAAAVATAFPQYASLATAAGALAGVLAVLIPDRGADD